MRVGHIHLGRSPRDHNEAFVNLIEALHCEGVEQHIVVHDKSIIDRLMPRDAVTLCPAVRSAITAYCVLPPVDVAHIHDPMAGQAGLLLTLTRSIPYVLTHRGRLPHGRNPLAHAIYKRAKYVICEDHADIDVLRHFDPGLLIEVIQDGAGPPATGRLLQIYQNSQRTPIAGNKGIQ